MYDYKMIQIPRTLQVTAKTQDTALASLMQDLVNQHAVGGWEFYRVDALSVMVPAGCLAALGGARETYTQYSVVCFRKTR
jgi:hypothetical protein